MTTTKKVSLGKPWKPKLWVPKAFGFVPLYILSEKDFKKKARKHGIAEDKGAFAVWGWWKAIYCKPDTINLIPHELRHFDEGHFH